MVAEPDCSGTAPKRSKEYVITAIAHSFYRVQHPEFKRVSAFSFTITRFYGCRTQLLRNCSETVIGKRHYCHFAGCSFKGNFYRVQQPEFNWVSTFSCAVTQFYGCGTQLLRNCSRTVSRMQYISCAAAAIRGCNVQFQQLVTGKKR